ncbi:FAD-binding oxidoreductase [Thermoleptolyngbya oregonensis NK1-22]|uniref:FAD-binding oxidoreductase n=1 Tax=Thermoleptolyngbya oregonensis NK1-22 TaxID=2547457 RepID=A0AA96Y6H1_9CYAN|nr:FAD-binding oxidoreductase [Thermoleptolyngbya oregonensis]WOB45166.1 FAD-binding oxidoreductase [Thermoleptolyngbya oregonensis NK1-22]
MSKFVPSLQSLVGAEQLSVWETVAPALKAQLSQAIAPGGIPECIVEPDSPAQLAAVVKALNAQKGRSLPFGTGTKLHWGGVSDSIQVGISTARMNQLIDHAAGDLTVTAQAGMRLADLQAHLARQNQFLPLNPSYGDAATLGGIIATADSGSLRHRYGGVRDLLIGVTLVRADGEIARAGGRVVKNVAGYDLMKLFTGSWGTLGILTEVTFRVYPLPEASKTLVLAGEREAIARVTQALLSSALAPVAVELVAPVAMQHLGHAGLGLVVQFQGLAVSLDAQATQFRQFAQAAALVESTYTDAAEASLWQTLQALWETAPSLTCKIGVLPNQAAATLEKIADQFPSLSYGTIHAGSGLGLLRFADPPSTSHLLDLRRLCEAQGGFLSLLAAPVDLKQQIDGWGYPGNALGLMRGIKQQFDPDRLLSPGRFVGGI